ncbi:hypothetical protein LTR66_001210 [Elasticomyces elasticus]|nr:hypothetical protein LTR66_001210 [Elasticomyces elasticus]
MSAGPYRQVIDITGGSSSDEDHFVTPNASPPRRRHRPVALVDEQLYRAAIGTFVDLDALDDDLPQLNSNYSEGDCLMQVLQIFPDIEHEHVLTLCRAFAARDEPNALSCEACSQSVIDQILEGAPYPKQKDRERELKQLKRKRDEIESDEGKEWEVPGRDAGALRRASLELLKEEFLELPINFIEKTFKAKKNLYATYLALYDAQSAHSTTTPPFRVGRARTANPGRTAAALAIAGYERDTLERELASARKTCERRRRECLSAAEKQMAEAANEQQARSAGQVVECAIEPHHTCWECAVTYIKAQISDRRGIPQCPHMDGCTAFFSRSELRSLSEPKLLETLEKLQQAQDLLKAGIEGMEECPFCDFKAICPPIDIDFEFRCLHPDCSKISCRRCRAETHTPKTCEEFAKESRLSKRHVVEEAMTEALIRSCNKCKTNFIKEAGCNKMTCTSCHHKQCYVCGKDVLNYEHFDRPGGCPLQDNVEKRHMDEVAKAEKEALAKVRAENPDITEEDLKIKVSEQVKAAEQQRIDRANTALDPGIGMPLLGLNGPFGARMYDDFDDRAEMLAFLGEDLARNGPAQYLHRRARHDRRERPPAIRAEQVHGQRLAELQARLHEHQVQLEQAARIQVRPEPPQRRVAGEFGAGLGMGYIPVYPGTLPAPLDHQQDYQRANLDQLFAQPYAPRPQEANRQAPNVHNPANPVLPPLFAAGRPGGALAARHARVAARINRFNDGVRAGVNAVTAANHRAANGANNTAAQTDDIAAVAADNLNRIADILRQPVRQPVHQPRGERNLIDDPLARRWVPPELQEIVGRHDDLRRERRARLDALRAQLNDLREDVAGRMAGELDRNARDLNHARDQRHHAIGAPQTVGRGAAEATQPRAMTVDDRFNLSADEVDTDDVDTDDADTEYSFDEDVRMRI